MLRGPSWCDSYFCGCVGDATGDVGVPPVVEMGIDVTWGDAPLWYAPFSDPEGLGFLKTLLGTTWSRRCVQDGCPVSVPCWLARSRDSDRRPRVGSSGVAETPLFNNVRTTIVRWRPLIDGGALVNPLQQDVLLDTLLSPMLL